MTEKYKLEKWNITRYKGQKNEYTSKMDILVKRDSKGHFARNRPIITKIRQKTYGTGVYTVGILNGKVVTRHKQFALTQEWKKEHKEEIQKRIDKRKIFRTSYVLNDIPFQGNVYYGFRIVAFSHNKQLLTQIKGELKNKLISFIERCVKYRRDEFWFNMYFGYEPPTISNAFNSENNKYYLMWQKRYGAIIKEESHNLGERF